MKALLNTYRQSPRKVRLLAGLIRGKGVKDAKNSLLFADKKAAPVIAKLLSSAISNAKNLAGVDEDSLFVKTITVDKGMTLKRSMPRARGSAFPINKRTSHIAIVLGVKQSKSELLTSKSEEKSKVKKSK